MKLYKAIGYPLKKEVKPKKGVVMDPNSFSMSTGTDLRKKPNKIK